MDLSVRWSSTPDGEGLRLTRAEQTASRDVGPSRYSRACGILPPTAESFFVREEMQTDGPAAGGITPAFRLFHGSGRCNSNPCWCSGNGGGDEFE